VAEVCADAGKNMASKIALKKVIFRSFVMAFDSVSLELVSPAAETRAIRAVSSLDKQTQHTENSCLLVLSSDRLRTRTCSLR
jgi:hypothetical protein